MNKYIFVLIVCAVVFLICFLIDTLFKVIFPKSKLEKSKQVVRPPRKSAVAGVILTFAGVAVLIKNLAGTPDTLFLIGSIVAIIFGVILLCTYFSVVIYFDDEGFLYKAWGHGKKEFRYSQIRGQRSLLTRGGVNTILFVGDEEINLYSAMQNLNAFLSKAFFKWCAVKGIDPDTIENNPRMATYSGRQSRRPLQRLLLSPVGADDSVRPQTAPVFTGICGESVAAQRADVGIGPYMTPANSCCPANFECKAFLPQSFKGSYL